MEWSAATRRAARCGTGALPQTSMEWSEWSAVTQTAGALRDRRTGHHWGGLGRIGGPGPTQTHMVRPGASRGSQPVSGGSCRQG